MTWTLCPDTKRNVVQTPWCHNVSVNSSSAHPPPPPPPPWDNPRAFYIFPKKRANSPPRGQKSVLMPHGRAKCERKMPHPREDSISPEKKKKKDQFFFPVPLWFLCLHSPHKVWFVSLLFKIPLFTNHCTNCACLWFATDHCDMRQIELCTFVCLVSQDSLSGNKSEGERRR